MKVLVLTGPESSGKSWLGAEIQAHFGGELVGEYVRHFIDEQQRDTCYADIATIATAQLAWEDAARRRQPPLLILDTHLLSNMLWSRVLFHDCPDWLEPALLSRRYDLHLLLSPDGVPWIADGQRSQPALDERRLRRQPPMAGAAPAALADHPGRLVRPPRHGAGRRATPARRQAGGLPHRVLTG